MWDGTGLGRAMERRSHPCSAALLAEVWRARCRLGATNVTPPAEVWFSTRPFVAALSRRCETITVRIDETYGAGFGGGVVGATSSARNSCGPAATAA